MIEKLVFLQFFGGGTIGDLLSVWQQQGFFSYLLPFLLIFALVFGILEQAKLFKENKAINGIIALVVGLMALQLDFVPIFFSEIFPRLGVGLSFILVLLILAGMFVDTSKGWLMYTLLGIGTIIAIIIFVQSAGAAGFRSGFWWEQNWQTVAGAVLILIIIGIIVGGSRKDSEPYFAIGWPPPSGATRK